MSAQGQQFDQGSSGMMEGFGSADVVTPLHYGSVNDGRIRMDGFEQKLRKQYWKTRQSLIQKMGKDQDEFIVAGDTDIDMKLEKAYHLRSTSVALLQAISKYSSKLRLLTRDEEAMGRYLMTWSETEYTNAGEVMQNVGKMQENDSQARLGIIPALMRMQSECAVFQSTAIRDLNFSIQRLEKARTDYRAALLWMKDVSDRLRNPDYHNQLARFRESQAAVKDSKAQFERLKVDLSEKIDMVFASRCNLLSRSLPYYQKELLSFYNNSANAFHKILVDLRSHHHHQYKVKRLLEEIRDLESEETPFTQEVFQDDGDEPLLDIGGGMVIRSTSALSSSSTESNKLADSGENVGHIQDENVLPPRESDPFSLEKITNEAQVNDLMLGGSEAELQALQSELIQPTDTELSTNSQASQQLHEEPSQSSIDEIDNLLKLGDAVLDDSNTPQPQQSQDELSDKWSSFSAFMTTETQNPHSGWEKEFASATTATGGNPTMSSELSSESAPKLASGDPTPSLQPLASGVTPSPIEASKETSQVSKQTPASGEDASSLLQDDLKSLGIDSTENKQSNPPPQPMSGLETLDPLLFQAGQQSLPRAPLQMSQPPVGQQLAPGQMPGMFRSPMQGSQMPIFPPAQLSPGRGGASPGQNQPPRGPSQRPGAKQEEGKDQGKGTAWMNVFAHLDPLVNEKV